MSRIGTLPISIPKNVKLKICRQAILAHGPCGCLIDVLPNLITCRHIKDPTNDNRQWLYIEPNLPEQYCLHQTSVEYKRDHKAKEYKKLYGFSRTRIANMLKGVTSGFEKIININGVGFESKVFPQHIELYVGCSQVLKVDIPKGLYVKSESPTSICIWGIRKDEVGEFAAKLRSLRPADPYKAKGLRYENELVRIKQVKTNK
jgi:large subunit ribosomal protein L6